MISTELFPYESFGVRLDLKTETRICWFRDEYDLQKYLVRSRLDQTTLDIHYRDGKPVDTSKKCKRSVEQKSKPNSKRSSATSKGRKPSVDSTRNTTRTPKSKK